MQALTLANLHFGYSRKLGLGDIERFLSDADFRYEIIEAARDEKASEMFGKNGLYSQLSERSQQEIVTPILRMLPSIGAGRSSHTSVNANKRLEKFATSDDILLIKLPSHGRSFYQAVLFSALMNSAVSAGANNSHKPRILIDECDPLLQRGSLLTEAVAEARKFGIGLVCACQGEISDPDAFRAVLANSFNLLSFRASPDTSALIAKACFLDKDYDPAVSQAIVQGLSNEQFCANTITKAADGAIERRRGVIGTTAAL